MSLSFTPAAAPAPAGRRVIAHALTETKLLIRNGEQLLLALVIPLGILIIGKIVGGTFGDLALLAPSVLALAIWSSAFTSVAIATGFERRYGVLERLAATPLGRPGLLAGKAISVIIVVGGQLVILVAAGLILGWRPHWELGATLVGLLIMIISIAGFVCLALAMAGRLRAEATLALANLVYVIFAAAGALVLPLARYPEFLQPIIRLLPTAALGEGLRAAASGVAAPIPLLISFVWLMLAAAAAWKGFRWTS